MNMLEVKEIAKLCGISTQSVIKRIARQEIVAEKVKGRWFIPESEVEKLRRIFNTRPVKAERGDKVRRYMNKLQEWCNEHPDADIKPHDYGKAVLHNIIK